MFEILKNIFKAAKEIKDEFDVCKSRTLEEVFLIEDKNNLVVAMYFYVDNKCDCGDNISTLSHEEKVLWLCKYLEGEILNGGTHQFLTNPSGQFADEVPSALREIGTPALADEFDKVISAFGGAIPQTEYELDAATDGNYSKFEKVFDAFDAAFCKYEDTFPMICYEYIMKNKDRFN